MKKNIIIGAVLFSALIAAGCSSQSSADIQSSTAASEPISAYEDDPQADEQDSDISQQVIESSSVSEEVSSLPYGLREYKDGLLEFISTSGKLTATFPDSLCVENKDYVPKEGIYLQTEDGKLTLQLENVESEGVDRDSLVDYLKETYPDAKVYITDSRLVICKMTTKDRSGNKICAYMKAKIIDRGYNEAVLYFHQEDSRQSENIFNKISLL